VTYRLMVTFHGGSSRTSINNVGIFSVADDHAQPVDPFYALRPSRGTSLGALPALAELRRMVMAADGTLLVANGYKDFSQLLQFSPSSTPASFEFASVYASDQLHHPFDALFAFGNDLYVSNQDADLKKSKSPAITFYSTSGANGQVFLAEQTFRALRGLAYDGNYLYVADAGGNEDGAFYGFDASGRKKVSHALEQPVHLLYDGTRYVYIGDEHKNAVYIYDTVTQNVPLGLITKDTGLDHTGGMALVTTSATSATLLVASRLGHAIMSYPLELGNPPTWDGTKQTLLSNLTDFPEFLLVPG